MTFSFHNPVALRFGRGCAGELVGALRLPALVVTGRATLQRTGLERLVDDERVFAWRGIPPNPTPEAIDACAARARELGVASIVGLGGGSALDAAKCVAVMLGHTDSIGDFQRRCKAGEAFERGVQLVQLPTTAGTGSEVTRWASVWSQAGEKSSMDHASGYADLALVDPAFTDSMDARLTAATGLDAMAHAMEALWGVHRSPFSDLHACAALGLVVEHLLPCVVADGGAGVAGHRDGMALAALHAGLALSATRSAAAHALSYAMTGGFGVDHGLAVGLLCRGLLPVNARAVPEQVARLLQAMGFHSMAQAQAFIDEVFLAGGMQPSLAAFGIPASAHDDIVRTATGADRLGNNPGQLGAPELTGILESIA